MRSEICTVQDFANTSMGAAVPGFQADSKTPAMATPIYAAQFVVQGSTICLVC